MALEWAVNGLLIAVGVLVVYGLIRVAYYYQKDGDASESAVSAGRDVQMVVGGAFAVGAMGLVQFADVLSMAGTFVGSHPFAVSNGLTAGIGALSLGGFLDVGPQQFIGIAIAATGLVLTLYEVSD